MEKYLDGCKKALKWCLQYQNEDGSLAMPEPCFDGLYKFAASMEIMGYHRNAAKLLNWLEMKSLQPNGDLGFGSNKVVFDWHKNFYLYTNSWIAIGAQRAGFFKLADRLVNYILTYQNPETGAFRSRPIESGLDDLCDTTITGNCGIACLFTGRLEEAFKAADSLCDLTEQQDSGPIFYTTMKSDGSILKQIPDDFPIWYSVDSAAPGQFYWHLGISAALLLHCYELNGEERYFKNALINLQFLEKCQDDVLQSFASGKYIYALALLYRKTGEKQYYDKVLAYCDWLLEVQKEDGRWTADQDDLPWYLTWDCTAEFIYWIKEVTAILSAPKERFI